LIDHVSEHKKIIELANKRACYLFIYFKSNIIYFVYSDQFQDSVYFCWLPEYDRIRLDQKRCKGSPWYHNFVLYGSSSSYPDSTVLFLYEDTRKEPLVTSLFLKDPDEDYWKIENKFSAPTIYIPGQIKSVKDRVHCFSM